MSGLGGLRREADGSAAWAGTGALDVLVAEPRGQALAVEDMTTVGAYDCFLAGVPVVVADGAGVVVGGCRDGRQSGKVLLLGRSWGHGEIEHVETISGVCDCVVV